ncbi:MAG: PEP-CTERM system TPR-repeat protein PrsT [Rubrivivax sp.]|nr:PEP-CTERM system TPR-repeat protein PrsT [Rubrivivax sp.]
MALTDLVKGKAEVAFDALQDIAARDPGETADLALISAHLGRHEYDAALAATALLERKLPTKPTAAYLRGLALRGKGDAAGARVAFEAALKIEPGHFASVASLVSLDLQEDKPDAAQQRLQAAIKLNPKNISARMAMVDLMVRQKAEPKVLLSAIDEAIKIAPADAAPHVAKIAQLSRMNDVKAAVSAAQNAMASLPQDPDVLQAAGRAMSNAGDEQQALSAFTRLAAAAPRSALPHLLLADVHAKLGDVAAAAFSLNRAFDTEPQSAEVHRRLLARASRTKNFKPVLAAAKELQKRFPQSAAGFLLEGDAEAARKDGPAALAAYRGSLKKADTLGIPQKQVFLTLRLSSDTAGAERFAVDWLKANPKDAGFRALLGGEAILRKDYSSAERYFRQVLVLQPDNGAAMNNLAWLMAERGANGAVALAENALKLAPGAAQVMDTLAKALAAEGYFARAIDIQKKALSVMPDYHEYRLNLARLYLKAGKRTEAGAELATLARLGGKFAFQVEVAEMRRALGD